MVDVDRKHEFRGDSEGYCWECGHELMHVGHVLDDVHEAADAYLGQTANFGDVSPGIELAERDAFTAGWSAALALAARDAQPTPTDDEREATIVALTDGGARGAFVSQMVNVCGWTHAEAKGSWDQWVARRDAERDAGWRAHEAELRGLIFEADERARVARQVPSATPGPDLPTREALAAVLEDDANWYFTGSHDELDTAKTVVALLLLLRRRPEGVEAGACTCDFPAIAHALACPVRIEAAV